MSYQKVPQRLEDYCNWLNTQRRNISADDIDKIYELSFLAHYNLVYIHPWADGNGRMSRLVMNMLQSEFGVIPSIVKKEKREEYIKSLDKSQTEGDPAAFVDFMCKHHIDNLDSIIKDYKKSIEDDTLNLENDTLNDTLNLTEKEYTVLKIIQSNLIITTNQIVQITGFSRPTVMRAIKTLKEKKLLERLDSKKTGSWKVNI
jgi:Fic family protein